MKGSLIAVIPLYLGVIVDPETLTDRAKAMVSSQLDVEAPWRVVKPHG